MKPGILINLYEDEKMVLIIRRHWLAFLQSIFITFILLLVFLISFFYINSKLNSPSSLGSEIGDNLARGVFVIFSSIYLLAACAFFYISWLDYYLDVFIITNKRILRIEQLVLFGQNISETSLQHIQDVSSKVKGIIYTILNVGTVFIETAGERANFTFEFIKDPGEAATQILELQKEMWGDEGFKEDLTLERKIEKIEAMNVGDPLRKKEEKAKEEEMKKLKNEEINPSEIPQGYSGQVLGTSKLINHELKKDPLMSLKKIWRIGIKKIRPDAKPDILVEEKEVKPERHYNDGRKITPEGVIWQSEQEVTEEVLETLNEMDGE